MNKNTKPAYQRPRLLRPDHRRAGDGTLRPDCFLPRFDEISPAETATADEEAVNHER